MQYRFNNIEADYSKSFYPVTDCIRAPIIYKAMQLKIKEKRRASPGNSIVDFLLIPGGIKVYWDPCLILIPSLP